MTGGALRAALHHRTVEEVLQDGSELLFGGSTASTGRKNSLMTETSKADTTSNLLGGNKGVGSCTVTSTGRSRSFKSRASTLSRPTSFESIIDKFRQVRSAEESSTAAGKESGDSFDKGMENPLSSQGWNTKDEKDRDRLATALESDGKQREELSLSGSQTKNREQADEPDVFPFPSRRTEDGARGTFPAGAQDDGGGADGNGSGNSENDADIKEQQNELQNFLGGSSRTTAPSSSEGPEGSSSSPFPAAAVSVDDRLQPRLASGPDTDVFQVSTSSDSSQNVAPKHLRSSEGLFAAPPSVVAGGSSSSATKVGGPSTTSTEDPRPTSDEAAHQPADPREEGDPAGRGAVEVAPAQGEDTPEDGLESLSARGEQAAGGVSTGSRRKAPNGPVREDDDMVELGKNEPKIIFDEETGTIQIIDPDEDGSSAHHDQQENGRNADDPDKMKLPQEDVTMVVDSEHPENPPLAIIMNKDKAAASRHINKDHRAAPDDADNFPFPDELSTNDKGTRPPFPLLPPSLMGGPRRPNNDEMVNGSTSTSSDESSSTSTSPGSLVGTVVSLGAHVYLGLYIFTRFFRKLTGEEDEEEVEELQEHQSTQHASSATSGAASSISVSRGINDDPQRGQEDDPQLNAQLREDMGILLPIDEVDGDDGDRIQEREDQLIVPINTTNKNDGDNETGAVMTSSSIFVEEDHVVLAQPLSGYGSAVEPVRTSTSRSGYNSDANSSTSFHVVNHNAVEMNMNYHAELGRELELEADGDNRHGSRSSSSRNSKSEQNHHAEGVKPLGAMTEKGQHDPPPASTPSTAAAATTPAFVVSSPSHLPFGSLLSQTSQVVLSVNSTTSSTTSATATQGLPAPPAGTNFVGSQQQHIILVEENRNTIRNNGATSLTNHPSTSSTTPAGDALNTTVETVENININQQQQLIDHQSAAARGSARASVTTSKSFPRVEEVPALLGQLQNVGEGKDQHQHDEDRDHGASSSSRNHGNDRNYLDQMTEQGSTSATSGSNDNVDSSTVSSGNSTSMLASGSFVDVVSELFSGVASAGSGAAEQEMLGGNQSGSRNSRLLRELNTSSQGHQNSSTSNSAGTNLRPSAE
ncbi:unnamed protein product [Amoebophrya sp. A120]|nr:unnamed protein product [Amoebophrya sp. A120]|eukprot:GSA120T00000194001.1